MNCRIGYNNRAENQINPVAVQLPNTAAGVQTVTSIDTIFSLLTFRASVGFTRDLFCVLSTVETLHHFFNCIHRGLSECTTIQLCAPTCHQLTVVSQNFLRRRSPRFHAVFSSRYLILASSHVNAPERFPS